MREILFRAKDCIHQQWFYGWYLYTPEFTWSQHNIISAKDWMNVKTVNPETVGQYTGLTDKNGTKIFEGDILHAAQGDFVVRWSESICSFVAGEKEKIRPCMNSGTMKHCEVIGNIFDNPELIELDIHKVETAESE